MGGTTDEVWFVIVGRVEIRHASEGTQHTRCKAAKSKLVSLTVEVQSVTLPYFQTSGGNFAPLRANQGIQLKKSCRKL